MAEAISVAKASFESGALKPNPRIASSIDAGWQALLLDVHEGVDGCDPFDTHPTPDTALVVALSGEHHLDGFRNGRWRRSIYQPSMAGIVGGNEIARLKWSSVQAGQPFRTAHLYLPAMLFAESAEEYRRAGCVRAAPLSALAFRDPAIAATVVALEQARRAGLPNLYAEQAARWIVTHLLSAHARQFDPTTDDRDPGSITDRRLARVIEFMSDRLDTDLQLTELSEEAGVSLHHFGRLFREKVGRTPHSYLVDLRMDLAERLLRTTDLSISEIAFRCGYRRPAAFSAAFLARRGTSPRQLREPRH